MSEPWKRTALRGRAITYKGLGGPEVIEVVEREVRAPAANEVRIAVKAAAVSPTDFLLRDPSFRSNLIQAVDQTARVVPGMDAAGVIESVGPGVSRLRPGEKVMVVVSPRRPEGGAYAQHIVAPAASVVHMPDGVSFAEASTLPMNGLTALLSLELAALREGQTLAVTGGAGLVAHYAIALAKWRGARVVADAKPAETALVESYGADIVVERGPDFAGAVRRALPDGVDALLDTAVPGEKTFGAIRDGGVYIPVRGWAGKLSERDIEIKPVLVHQVLERTEWLEQLRGAVAAGRIKPLVAGEYTPERAGAAQDALAAGGLRGRPVIVF
jgi:NADPH:quinone reductase-like Zn-dependent oxidoreductase